MIVFVIPVY